MVSESERQREKRAGTRWDLKDRGEVKRGDKEGIAEGRGEQGEEQEKRSGGKARWYTSHVPKGRSKLIVHFPQQIQEEKRVPFRQECWYQQPHTSSSWSTVSCPIPPVTKRPRSSSWWDTKKADEGGTGKTS
jgi:hypothetical protein